MTSDKKSGYTVDACVSKRITTGNEWSGASDQSHATPYIALKEMESAWNAAARSWDPAGLAQLYAADGLLFGGRPEHSVGLDAIREYFSCYLGVILSANLDLFGQQVQALGDEVFLAQGFGKLSFVLSGDRKSEALFRTTWILRKESQWKIVLHHFSEVPSNPPLGD